MIDRRLVPGLISAAAVTPERVFSQQGDAVLKHVRKLWGYEVTLEEPEA